MNKEVYSRTKKSKDDWETPQYFFDLLDEEFHFTLDPCASFENKKCEKYYTEKDDGLMQNWTGETVFIADLIRLVLASSQYILGIGREVPNTFENIYITRKSMKKISMKCIKMHFYKIRIKNSMM